jgi:hypothetical protein
MAYLGNNLQAAYSSYLLIDSLSASFNGTTTSFALKVNGVAPVPFPLNEQNVLISVGGVPQKPDPTGAEGFKFSGTNIVFSSAPKTGEAFWGVVLAGADYVNVGVSYPDGAAATPSITFNSNKTTGIYLSGVSTLGFTTAGVLRSTIDSNGNLSILSAGSATIPAVAVGTGTTYAPGIYSPGTDQVAISTNGTERMKIDSAGTTTLTSAASTAPFVTNISASEVARIDSGGKLLVGTSTARTNFAGVTSPLLQIETATNSTNRAISILSGNSGVAPPILIFGRQTSDTIGGNTIVSPGLQIGGIVFQGSDGTNFLQAASISAFSDGTPGTTDMPGRLTFSTTPDGLSVSIERMRITNDGIIAYNQQTPAAVDTTATLTIANLKTGIITSTSAAATDMTLPTGTDTDTGFYSLPNNHNFQWSVINTGPSLVRVLANTGHTVVGSGSVATGTSGRFASRKSSTSTFVTYRLA